MNFGLQLKAFGLLILGVCITICDEVSMYMLHLHCHNDCSLSTTHTYIQVQHQLRETSEYIQDQNSNDVIILYIGDLL